MAFRMAAVGAAAELVAITAVARVVAQAAAVVMAATAELHENRAARVAEVVKGDTSRREVAGERRETNRATSSSRAAGVRAATANRRKSSNKQLPRLQKKVRRRRNREMEVLMRTSDTLRRIQTEYMYRMCM